MINTHSQFSTSPFYTKNSLLENSIHNFIVDEVLSQYTFLFRQLEPDQGPEGPGDYFDIYIYYFYSVLFDFYTSCNCLSVHGPVHESVDHYIHYLVVYLFTCIRQLRNFSLIDPLIATFFTFFLTLLFLFHFQVLLFRIGFKGC